VHNGDEVDVDCGGGCALCAPGQACTTHGDCAGGACVGGVCAPTCTDAVLGEHETDVDCGGIDCPACANGSSCVVESDCESHLCTSGICEAASCSDSVKSGLETDVDCGGPDCNACENGESCVYLEDCLSGACNEGTCGRWVKVFEVGYQSTGMVAFDPFGDVIFTNATDNPVSYGGPPLTSTAVVKYAPTGLHLWSKSIAGTGYPRIATQANGDVVVAMTTFYTTDFGCGVETGDNTDIGVVTLSSATGACLSHAHYGGADFESPRDVAVAPNGDIVIAGIFDGSSLDLGNIVIDHPSAPAMAFFVARLDASGTAIWGKSLGAPTILNWNGIAVAVTPSGAVLVAGHHDGTVDFAPPCQNVTVTGSGVFLAKLSAAGDCLWSRGIDGTGGFVLNGGLGSDASGNAVIVGSFAGTADFGAGPVNANAGLFLGKYASTDGMHLWSAVAGDAVNVDGSPIPIDIDSAGDILVSGRFQGPLNLGGGVLPFPGAYPVYAAKFSGSNGAHLYSTSFAGPGGTDPWGVAMSPVTKSAMVMGKFSGVANFGTGPITAANLGSVYLLSLGPVP
jgi:hypothetical protein